MAEAAQAAADTAQQLADMNAANVAAMQNNLAALVAAVAQQAIHPQVPILLPIWQEEGTSFLLSFTSWDFTSFSPTGKPDKCYLYLFPWLHTF